MFNDESPKRISGFMFVFGLISFASILGFGLYKSALVFSSSKRKISAVGSAETQVKSNIGSFVIRCVVMDANSDNLDAKSQELLTFVNNFLTAENVKTEEILLTQEGDGGWGDKHKDLFKKIMLIHVKSKDIDFISKLSHKAILNLNKNPIFKYSVVEAPLYFYHGLVDLKNNLLAEATKNAYESANTILSGTKQKLGEIISIRQGYISDYANYESRVEIMKTAKIVVDVVFELQ